MCKDTLFKISVVTVLSFFLFSSCEKQPEGSAEKKPQTSSVSALAANEPQPKLAYTTMPLTSDGISVEAGEAYYLPMGEGKYIPANDTVWKAYLNNKEFSALESFSMPFVAVDCGDSALVYVMENPYRSIVRFSCDSDIRIKLVGEVSALNPLEGNKVRMYTVENSAVAVANAYSSYLAETGELLTLAQKAERNPNIAKLYGAPHIYLWGDFLLSDEDVKWRELIKAADSPVFAYIGEVLAGTAEADGQFTNVLGKIKEQTYVDNYQRRVLLRGFSTALTQENFYDPAVFTKTNAVIESLLAKGALNSAERIELHKQALYESLKKVFQPVEQWYDYDSVDILGELKAAGIETAWIGLNSWEQAFCKPQLVEAAIKNGYLAGPYDSYHSIHQQGKEQWNTAAFPDMELYESATVQNEKGEKIAGFQNTGRKLNPTLALPSVKQRVQEILSTGVPFNSWFVDCDATGEVYDDYSPSHSTTKQQDIAARMERLNYISSELGMVIGSEGGNDFAANNIAFAHGIELQSFSWMDEDMKTNKNSEYYLGRYYSASGGVPEKFAKPVPVKETYRKLFLDMSYQIPLYKLVYNDSVITASHWDWSTFKIVGESENRMLREILYNVPSLYHLDRNEWDTYKDRITEHNAVWSAFSKEAITRKMTAFAWLTNDRLVQTTCYGSDLQVIANFSGAEYVYEETTLPPHAVLIIDSKGSRSYKP